MSTETRLMSADELWRLPDNGKRHELVKGELRTMTPGGGEHGAIIINLSVPLAQYVKARRLGAVFGAETGFIVARDPDTVRGADVAYVSSARIPAAGIPKAYVPFAPDLAVEVLSPHDTVYATDEKVEDWLNGGTAAVWVVNPRRRTVTVHRPGRNPVVLAAGDSLDGEDVVPGFRQAIAEIFV